MKHDKDQDVLRSCVDRIQKLRAKSPHVRKRYTRRVPTYDEGLQYSNWRDRNHKNLTGKTHFLNNMLRGEALTEFEFLVIQVGITTNGHLKLIKEVLLGYFTPPMKLTSRNSERDAQCKNLDISWSRYLLHNWRNWITTFRFYLDRESPRKWTLKNWTILSSNI